MKKLKIWIDVTNSPHVLFFRPIIKELENRGHYVFVTSRDFAQTINLLKFFNITHKKIGKYGGKNIFMKGFALISRSYLLFNFVKKKKFDLALSHNSVDVCLVSKLLKIPIIDLFDYEFAQFHHINFRCATKIMCPSYINKKDLVKYGVGNKLITYEGLKEQMYLSDYKFDPQILSKLNINKNRIIVVFRPPAEMSLYHKGTKNLIYLKIINYLSKKKEVCVVYLGRDQNQINLIKEKKYKNFIIPEIAIDAPSLIRKADLVISAGGTMNREAAALGTPVYTILALKKGAVDKYLIKSGLLRELNNIKKIKLKKKNKSISLKSTNPEVLVDIFLNFFKFDKIN